MADGDAPDPQHREDDEATRILFADPQDVLEEIHGDPRAPPPDIEAARVKARVRELVFQRPREPVRIARFELVRRLGAGAMGLVYEVIDPRTSGHLALKTVRTHNPQLLALFKREFRSLARVTHANLVSLYELGRDGQTFFFTMELIRGTTLLRALWGSDAPPSPPQDLLPASPILDFDRLRALLGQLAAGVAALHDAGKLHRDIKPTNVMVTAEGRVVVMDFGFVSDQLGSLLESTQGSMVVGTPAFMPPEQSRGERLGAAADWYSVGATLYLALTGSTPFSRLSAAERLLHKESVTPPHPRLLARGIPADLADLCLDLLRPDPADRPSEAAILQRTQARAWGRRGPRPQTPPHPTPERPHLVGLVGLAEPLAALQTLFTSRSDTLRIARVIGAAGQGKTRLVTHFLETVRAHAEPKPLVIRSRCNPGDGVPAQAVDGLVDGLARHLRHLGDEELAPLLPEHAASLVQVFPVLSQVPALAALAGPPTLPRAAAFLALRQLLASLARRRPLLLWIDDLQWSDPEGCRRLVDLLAPPAPPPLMIILSYRSEDEDAACNPELAHLLETLGGPVIPVEPLTTSEARDLALALAGPTISHTEATRLAAEAEGCPLWIHELTRLRAHELAEPTLADYVALRLRELPRAAVDLVAFAALTAEPLPLQRATAAGIREDHAHRALRRAIAANLLRLLRLPNAEGGPRIVPLSERVREAILTCLSGHLRERLRELLREHPRPALPHPREYHRRLAAALEGGSDTPELLIHHLRGAGELDRAQHYALLHAESAWRRGEAIHAATLFRLAHELGHEDRHGLAVLHRLSQALAAAGHEVAAAEALLRSLGGTALTIDRSAACLEAARLLLAHSRDGSPTATQGQRLLAATLQELGLQAPGTPDGPLATLLRRGQRRLRGIRFRERPESAIDRRTRLQIDATWTACVGLFDHPAHAAEISARHLDLALTAGDLQRIGRAFALEALRIALQGGDLERADSLLENAHSLAERLDHRPLAALSAIAISALHLRRLAPRAAQEAAFTALGELQPPTVAGWERSLAQAIALDATLLLGDLRRAHDLATGWLREARERGAERTSDALEERLLRLRILTGDPAARTGALTADLASAPTREPHRRLLAIEAALAADNGEAAQRLLREAPLPQALPIDLEPRIALARGDLGDLQRSIEHLRRDRSLGLSPALCEALALPLTAALASARGEASGSDHLAAAAATLDGLGLGLHAAACRWRRCADDTPEVQRELASELASQGISAPPILAAILLPWPRGVAASC